MGVATCGTVPTNINPFPVGDFVVGIMDFRDPPPNLLGENWGPPMYHGPNDSWTQQNLGQIFGIALDADGNIYVTTTTSYGTTPDPDVVLIGPAGPGAVYRLDGVTGAISTFAQLPNSGPGLGNICYDRRNNQLFVTNFEDGRLYRYAMDGRLLSTFDPLGPDDGRNGFAPLGERPWGIGVFADRVYYGVWTEHFESPGQGANANEVRSVGLDDSGDFLADDRREFTVSPLRSDNYSNPIADIAFAEDGRMLLAERSMEDDDVPNYHRSRVLEYQFAGGVWSYAQRFHVGNLVLPRNLGGNGVDHDNSSGGTDYGYEGYDPEADQLLGCERTVWSGGDGLKFERNPRGADEYIYGLARMPADGNTAANVSTTSYYIDLDGDLSVLSKTQVGDVEVFRQSCLEPTGDSVSICLEDSARLTVPNGLEYRWTPANGLSCTDCPSPTASPDSTTVYTATTLTNLGHRIEHRRIVTVRDCRPPTVDSVDICLWDSARLSVPDGLSYSWSPATGLSCTSCPDPVAFPTRTTTYLASVTSVTGDVLVHERTVVVTDCSPQTFDSVLTCGEPVALSVPEGVAYNWQPPDGLSCSDCRSPIALPDRTTTYNIDVTSLTGEVISHRRVVTVEDEMELTVTMRPPGVLSRDHFRLPVILSPAPDRLKIREFTVSVSYTQSNLILENGTETEIERLLAETIADGWTVEIIESRRGIITARITSPDGVAYLKDGGMLLNLEFLQVISDYYQTSFIDITLDIPNRPCLTIRANRGTVPNLICGADTRLIELVAGKYAFDVASTEVHDRARMSLSLPFDGAVRAEVFDVGGKSVGVLVDEQLGSGTYDISWNAGDVPVGVYVVRVTAGGWVESRKIRVVD